MKRIDYTYYDDFGALDYLSGYTSDLNLHSSHNIIGYCRRNDIEVFDNKYNNFHLYSGYLETNSLIYNKRYFKSNLIFRFNKCYIRFDLRHLTNLK